ncbi:hypothetical protein [Luteolibacter soli]|uniref:Transmembrane protein n=1 Tax=Luteolibacter soli TaxID=3135280 RepID=A0ABU9AVI7_9BACT
MSQPPYDGGPPPNRAIGWYRFVLWMMPTCVAITSAIGLGWLANVTRFRGGDLLVLVWFVFNIAAATGIGFFEAKLERSPRPGRAAQSESAKVVKFVSLQFIVVPLMSCVIAFGYCLMGGF